MELRAGPRPREIASVSDGDGKGGVLEVLSDGAVLGKRELRNRPRLTWAAVERDVPVEPPEVLLDALSDHLNVARRKPCRRVQHLQLVAERQVHVLVQQLRAAVQLDRQIG